MPLKLSTTIGKIQNIPNSKNIEIINEFLEYMRSNGSSEHETSIKKRAIEYVTDRTEKFDCNLSHV